jgi:hypothetical protein
VPLKGASSRGGPFLRLSAGGSHAREGFAVIAVQPRSGPRRSYCTVSDDELTPVANGERLAQFISDARLVILSAPILYNDPVWKS